MYKNIVALLLGTIIATSVMASNRPEQEIDLKSHYTSHIAVQESGPKVENFSDRLPIDLAVHLCDFMDIGTALNFITCCRRFNTKVKEVSVRALPRFYKSIGLNYGDVFLNLDHPQWTPEALPVDIAHKLHYGWFSTALKLMGRVNPSNEDVQRAYHLYYSAGRLGHILAAQAAEELWMNPAYHTLLPVVTLDSNLEPESVIWDICRLNRPLTDPALADLGDNIQDALMRMELDECPSEETKVLIKDAYFRVLNCHLTEKYNYIFDDLINDIEGSDIEENNLSSLKSGWNETPEVKNQHIVLSSVTCLLGSENIDFERQMDLDFFNGDLKSFRHEALNSLFLCNLIITRNPTLKAYINVRYDIRDLMTEFRSHFLNSNDSGPRLVSMDDFFEHIEPDIKLDSEN